MLNRPPPPAPALSVDDGGGVPKVKGAGEPEAGEFVPPLPNVNDGAAVDPGCAAAPNENDVVGAMPPPLLAEAAAGAPAPNWNAPLGGALPNENDVVGAGAAAGTPNENDVVGVIDAPFAPNDGADGAEDPSDTGGVDVAEG